MNGIAQDTAQQRNIRIEKMKEGQDILSYRLPRIENEYEKRAAFMAFLSCILLIYITFRGVTSPYPKDRGVVLLSIPVGIVIFLCAVSLCIKLWRRTEIILSPQWLTLRYAVFGIVYSRRLPFASLRMVERSEGKLHEIILHSDHKSLRFGAYLTSEERQWIQKEVQAYREEYVISSPPAIKRVLFLTSCRQERRP
jgi:hypothetical protein